EAAGRREDGAVAGRAVAFRKDEAVTVFPGRALRIDPQHVEVEDDENVDHRKRAAEVRGAGLHAEPDRLLADLAGACLERAYELVGALRGSGHGESFRRSGPS